MCKHFFLVVIGLAVLHSPFTHAATYGGGGGTADNPYQIRTPQQMNSIGANPGDWGKHFRLMTDIDMGIYTGAQYNVIGDVTTKFTGVFDGGGHVIRNLTYSTTNVFYSIGVFGRTANATIKNLGVENVLISTRGGWVGALVGRMEGGSVTACYVIGSVTGQYDTGGLAGRIDSGSISVCYARCAVAETSNSTYAGGLAGDNRGSITACYAAGTVSGSTFLLGGLAGNNGGSLAGCFWDTQVSGKSKGVGTGSTSGVTGQTTSEMMTLATFTGAGWDFTASDGDAAEWWMVSNDYPRQAWQFPYGAGSGTAEEPYEIWTPEQMNAIGENPSDWDKDFRLMADLDMSLYTGTQYHIIGNATTQFTGVFDGNGYILQNLSYTTTGDVDYVSVFGRTANAAIYNLGVENVSFSTGGSWVGGLTGYKQWGILSGCFVTGAVSGDRVGGLAGYNYSGLITTCYAAVSVSGTTTSYVGGLVGYNDIGSPVDTCYSVGSVSGGGLIGGLMGYCNPASLVTACFWDTQTSVQATSAAGTGITTIEMKTYSTFTPAGWDFVETWGIGGGQTYPYLKLFAGINPADIDHSGTVDFQDLAILAANWLGS